MEFVIFTLRGVSSLGRSHDMLEGEIFLRQ